MLTFNLKKEWFDKIKSDEKTHEYRLCTDYWDIRVLNLLKKYLDPDEKELGLDWTKRSQSTRSNFSIPIKAPCRFTLGYPSNDDKERILYGIITHIWLSNNKIDNLNSDLHTEEPIYDFEFELIKEQ